MSAKQEAERLNLSANGPTAEAASENLRKLIADRLAAGGRIDELQIDGAHPLAAVAGALATTLCSMSGSRRSRSGARRGCGFVTLYVLDTDTVTLLLHGDTNVAAQVLLGHEPAEIAITLRARPPARMLARLRHTWEAIECE